MPDPATLRDSTQIVLPCEAIEGIRDRMEAQFTVTVFCAGDSTCRIIGSPVEIKRVGEYLMRHGVAIQ
jgi:hypothetical protein